MWLMPFGEMPEEVRRAIEQQQDQQAMEAEVLRHRIDAFFESLDVEQLTVMRIIMTHAGAGGSAYTSYVEGVCGTMLKYKFHLCGCGKNHEEELLTMQTLETSVSQWKSRVEAVDRPEPGTDEDPSPAEVAAATADMMIEYGVRYPTNADKVVASPGERPVICTGCGALYQSLDDRMLQEPGVKGCSGCQQKAKWG